MDFCNYLTSERTKRNLSYRKAADLIGISHTYLVALEKGEDTRGLPANKPTPETLKLISLAYGTDYNRLLEMCGYTSIDDYMPPSNPDIRLIARAGKNLSSEQAEQLRKYAEYMYPEAFDNGDDKK